MEGTVVRVAKVTLSTSRCDHMTKEQYNIFVTQETQRHIRNIEVIIFIIIMKFHAYRTVT